MSKSYDIFLSKNTLDIETARKIVDVLESYGLKVFESSSELSVIGNADYAQAIDEALENSKHMIVLCSESEHGSGNGSDSLWVYYEWTSFRNEILSKRKSGNIVVVLNGEVELSSIAYGLRRYEVISFNSISSESFINYFTKNNTKEKTPVTASTTPIKVDENLRANYLKAFDFGHHMSMNIFAKQQGSESLFDINEDFDNFWKIPVSVFGTGDPDLIMQAMSESYGEMAAKYFSFGQRTGLLSIIILFIRKGANISQSQKDVFFAPFLKEGRALLIPDKTLKTTLDLVSQANSGQQVVNLHKVIRHAIASHSYKSCPWCGCDIAIDSVVCNNCHTPIEHE